MSVPVTTFPGQRPTEPGTTDRALRLRDIVAWGEPWDYEDDDLEDTAPAAS
ncbi:MAG: hypothetical protein NVS3B12_30370 [Acidimicrobiales bacterium]